MLKIIKRKGFRDAYVEYYPIVMNILYLKVKNYEDAEDICQEVFIRFYNNIEKIDNQRSWIFRAIDFEVLNFYRKKDNKTSFENKIYDGIDVRSDPSNAAREARIIVNEAINEMKNFESDVEKNLFDLIAIYNYTYHEAADCLGLSISQVEYRYKRVSRRILDYLRNKGIRKVGELYDN